MVSRNGKLGPRKGYRIAKSNRTTGTPAANRVSVSGLAGAATGAVVGSRGLNNLSADRQRRLLNNAIKHKFPAITRPAIFLNETLTRVAGANDVTPVSEADAKVVMERIAQLLTSGALGPESVPLGSVPYVVLYFMNQNEPFARSVAEQLSAFRNAEGEFRDIPNALAYFAAQSIADGLLNAYKQDWNAFLGALSGIDMSVPSTQRPIELITELERVPSPVRPGNVLQGGLIGAQTGSVLGVNSIPGVAFVKAGQGGGSGATIGNCQWVNGQLICDGQF